MPAQPHFLYIFGKEGALKIDHQVIPHHFSGTYRNIGIAGEIAVYLYNKKESCHYECNPAMVFGIGIYSIYVQGKAVCYHQFFYKTPQHDLQPFADAVV